MGNATVSRVNRDRLRERLDAAGEPAYRADQVWQWATRGVTGYAEMTNVPAALRELLEQKLPFSTLEVEREEHARDGTVKALFRTHDRHPVEAVLMRYRDGRRSICLSSQSGCPLTCSFCATGQMRFGRQAPSDIPAQKQRDRVARARLVLPCPRQMVGRRSGGSTAGAVLSRTDPALRGGQGSEKVEDDLVEHLRYLEVRKVTAVGEHHARRTPDARLDCAGVGVNVGDVRLSDDHQYWQGDLSKSRERVRCGPGFQACLWIEILRICDEERA
jgi:hypothetical protein